MKTGPQAHVTDNLGSVDHYFDTDRIKKTPGQSTRRDFNYFVLGGGRVVWATGARLALMSVSDCFPIFPSSYPLIVRVINESSS